jgi:hypothetical protein
MPNKQTNKQIEERRKEELLVYVKKYRKEIFFKQFGDYVIKPTACDINQLVRKSTFERINLL